jgi:uncharacterized protein (TIGR00369 family)
MSTRSTRANSAPAGQEQVHKLGITQLLGIRLTSIAKSKVEGEMQIGDAHMNRNRKVNGGAIMTLGDIMGAAGTIANLAPGCRTSTIESKTNFFAGGEGPVIKAVSIPLHIGRTTMVWQTTVRNLDGRMVAIVTQTQIVMAAPPDAKPTAAAAKRASKPAKRTGAHARTRERTA